MLMSVLLCCTPSMSQARGTMFDQVIHHFLASRDEEKRLSYAQELRIEVLCF